GGTGRAGEPVDDPAGAARRPPPRPAARLRGGAEPPHCPADRHPGLAPSHVSKYSVPGPFPRIALADSACADLPADGASTRRHGVQLLNVSPVRMRTREPDEACAQAIDLARAAVEQIAGAANVGVPVAMEAEQDRVVTHLFACLNPAYPGWRWAVTVS